MLHLRFARNQHHEQPSAYVDRAWRKVIDFLCNLRQEILPGGIGLHRKLKGVRIEIFGGVDLLNTLLIDADDSNCLTHAESVSRLTGAKCTVGEPLAAIFGALIA